MIYVLYIVIVTALLFFLYFRWQYSMLFHPKLYRDDPFDERFHFLSITTEDNVKLEGCIFEPMEYKRTLLYFGGRGQDSVGLLPKLSRCYSDFRIITFNYRGYGKSEGVVNERNMMQDALLVYDKVVKNFGEIDLLGFSLGCAVASYVAANRDAKRVFLIAPFASLESLVRDIYGFSLPLLRYRFDTCAHIALTNAKITLFVSKDDNVVPVKNARRLKECAKLYEYKEFCGLSHVEMLCQAKL